MEEKLYFKPANYGKGKKKEQSEQKSEPKTKKNRKAFKLVIVLLVLTVIVAVIIWLLRGKTTTTSEKIPNVKSSSLICSSNSFVYPIFTYDEAKVRNLNIKIISTEDKLKSISLEYTLFYDSIEAATGSAAHNHGAMNISFGKVGLKPDSYNAKYTILSDQFRMNLYATEKKLDETAKRYFLIETEGAFPTHVTELKQNYEAQGFTCETSE